MSTQRRITVLCGIPLLVLVCYLAWRLAPPFNSQVVKEGEAAVVAFLKEGADGAFSEYGPFIELTGEGYYTPAWNIQRYYYLGLNRQARSASNTFRVKIMLEGLKVEQISRHKVEGSVDPRNEVLMRGSHPALYRR